MPKKYQVPFVLRENGTTESKIAFVAAETKYQAAMIVEGMHVKYVGEASLVHKNPEAAIDHRNIVEIVEYY